MAPNTTLLARALFIVAAYGVHGAPALAQENERGEALFDLCSSCHGPDAGGRREFLAPAIAGMSEWYVVVQLQKFQKKVL